MAIITDDCDDEYRLSEIWKKVLIFSLAIVLRAAVSIHPYSGEKTPPRFGDFEAQRHWMEIALHVPARDWYRETATNNLTYWGLDYPPLSGYVSWVFGHVLQRVDRNSVALRTSWGYESEVVRTTMRVTVIVADLLVYLPAIALFKFRVAAFASMLPALVLMDHGHFQYNALSLGLCVFAFSLYRSGRDALGAAMFCAAVYFKHLCLYFALGLLAHHVAQMCRAGGIKGAIKYATKVLFAIGIVTVITFAPWISSTERMVGVLRRLFPVARGIYEDKVANVWCSISILIKVQRVFTKSQLVVICATTTILFSLPFCMAMFRRRQGRQNSDFILACTGCALAAFLFSFQVHEKQILIPLVASTLVFESHPRLCMWMSMAASMSLFPLLSREGLVSAYIAVNLIHILLMLELWPSQGGEMNQAIRALEIVLVYIGGVLHFLLLFVNPPTFAKDAFVLLLTGFSCAIFCGVYLAIVVDLWSLPKKEHEKQS